MDILSSIVELKMEKINMAALKANHRAAETQTEELLRLAPQSPNGNGIGERVDITG